MNESDHQIEVFRLAKLLEKTYPLLAMLYAVPNGGHRHPATGKRLKAEGCRRGIPDMCLAVSKGGYHGLYIELKLPEHRNRKTGKGSEHQQDWLSRLNAQGYLALISYGFVETTELLCAYLDEEVKR
jgi:hypothetical protein|tara:strand:+ start:2399 stop:2779 length:381 start_codon:yes stop_codon:yes gene_type:complete